MNLTFGILYIYVAFKYRIFETVRALNELTVVIHYTKVIFSNVSEEKLLLTIWHHEMKSNL